MPPTRARVFTHKIRFRRREQDIIIIIIITRYRKG